MTNSLPDEYQSGARKLITEQNNPVIRHSASNSVHDILHAVRTYLDMDVAFVSEFVGGRRLFRYVDSKWIGNPVRETNDGPFISVPILLADGSIYGALCCLNHSPGIVLDKRDLSLMRVFAGLTGKMIDRERALSVTLASKHDQIRRILSGDLLFMVYQPIFDLHSGQITGFESLARFADSPVRTPDLWFDDAHEAGLGIELELRAVEIALSALPRFSENTDLAINASPDTVLDHRFAQMLDRLPSLNRVVLEITEHSAVERYEAMGARLKAYRERGLRIAVDDAGAGYASFKHILNLGPDLIKLDMSLTRDINADPARRALAAALIHFCCDTGSQLIAEGVETAAEVATLMELGVKKAQGFFLGAPMSVSGLADSGMLISAPATTSYE